MKLKPNINVDAVKRLLIQHGEKAAFGLAFCVLLLFFWNTLHLEVLGPERQPEPLRQLADKTRAHVIASPWTKKIEVVDYPARAEHVPLNELEYPLTVYFDKPLWDKHGKRPTPKLWTVEELQATPGQGVFAVKKEGGNNAGADDGTEIRPAGGTPSAKGAGAKLAAGMAPRGYYYVAVTGVVPLRKQTGEYDDAFSNAEGRRKDQDQPVYEDIGIERAEITGGSSNKLAWQEIDLAAADDFETKWPKEQVPDVVDLAYTDVFTRPLAAMLGQDWDPVVVGHPKIPLAERFAQSKTDKPEEKEPSAAPQERIVRVRPKPGQAGGAAPKPAEQPKAAGAGTASPKADQKLFRFVDYFVEPGKQYRYRVKLKLHNPNQGVQDRYLKEPALARTPTVETAWSEPTPVVVVPRGGKILAGPASGKPNMNLRDPDAEVCVVVFDRQRGGEPAVMKLVRRGTLLNFPEPFVWVPTAADHALLAKWDKFDFHSNALVVDLQGGRKLGQRDKSLTEPIEMLILDGEGRVSVHDELDDAEEFHARLDPLTKESTEKKSEPVMKANPYEKAQPKPRGEGSKPKSTKPRTPAN